MKKSILLASGFICLSFIFPLSSGFTHENKPVPKEITTILTKNNCISCHTAYRRLVGPSFQNIAKMKYDAKKIAELIENPKPANWPGYPAMAPQKNVPYEDILKLTAWMNTL